MMQQKYLTHQIEIAAIKNEHQSDTLTLIN